MNKTEHVELNQWDPADRILREDFNADNAKIDAALAGKAGALEIINDIKLSGLSHGIGLNPSAELKDWEYVLYLFIYPEVEGATASSITYSLTNFDDPVKEYVIGTLPSGHLLMVLWSHHDGGAPIQGLVIGKELAFFQGNFPCSQLNTIRISAQAGTKMPSPRMLILGRK